MCTCGTDPQGFSGTPSPVLAKASHRATKQHGEKFSRGTPTSSSASSRHQLLVTRHSGSAPIHHPKSKIKTPHDLLETNPARTSNFQYTIHHPPFKIVFNPPSPIGTPMSPSASTRHPPPATAPTALIQNLQTVRLCCLHPAARLKLSDVRPISQL